MEVHGSIWNFSHFSEYLLGLNIQMLTAKYFREYHIYEDVGVQPFCQATDSELQEFLTNTSLNMYPET